jgi:hypothetical protein
MLREKKLQNGLRELKSVQLKFSYNLRVICEFVSKYSLPSLK